MNQMKFEMQSQKITCKLFPRKQAFKILRTIRKKKLARQQVFAIAQTSLNYSEKLVLVTCLDFKTKRFKRKLNDFFEHTKKILRHLS